MLGPRPRAGHTGRQSAEGRTATYRVPVVVQTGRTTIAVDVGGVIARSAVSIEGLLGAGIVDDVPSRCRGGGGGLSGSGAARGERSSS